MPSFLEVLLLLLPVLVLLLLLLLLLLLWLSFRRLLMASLEEGDCDILFDDTAGLKKELIVVGGDLDFVALDIVVWNGRFVVVVVAAVDLANNDVMEGAIGSGFQF